MIGKILVKRLVVSINIINCRFKIKKNVYRGDWMECNCYMF